MFKLALIVVGAGHQGQTLLRHLPELIRHHRTYRNVDLRLVAIQEPNAAQRDAVLKRFHYLPSDIFKAKTPFIGEVLAWADASDAEYDACVVYDASPTHLHLHNLGRVADYDQEFRAQHRRTEQFLYYFGEKPILAIDPISGRFSKTLTTPVLNHVPHFCNFIELHNPVVLNALDIVRSQGIRLTDMYFWRYGPAGMDLLTRRSRVGITGGAFADKSVHDLAIAVALAEASYRSSWITAAETAIGASVEWVLPAQLSNHRSTTVVATAINGGHSGHTAILPADANASAWFRMAFDADSGVNCFLKSGWLGVPEDALDLQTMLEPYAAQPLMAIGKLRPSDLVPGYSVQEARLMLLRGFDQMGNQVEICGNLLMREQSGLDDICWSTSTYPWLTFRVARGDVQAVQLSRSLHGDAFKDIFDSVIRQVVGSRDLLNVPVVDRHLSVAVHSTLISLRTHLDQAVVSGGGALLSRGHVRAMSLLRRPYCFRP